VSTDSTIREWLESTKNNGMALGLENTYTILSSLNLNFDNTKIIHVAGSNGKGTLCSLIAASLTLSNKSNVLFSSPHLCRVEERIRLEGRPISGKLFDQAVTQVRAAAERLSIIPTFFEATFLAAMIVTNEINPKFLILETGLGGRLDATRCAPADLAILTSITKEHTDVLGDDIYQIISEKAAIARPGKLVIAREMEIPNYQQTVRNSALDCARSELNEASDIAECIFVKVPDNLSIIDEAELLAKAAFNTLGLDSENLSETKMIVNWPARLQELTLPSSHRLILDAAHNPSGLARVQKHLIDLAKKGNDSDYISLIFGTSPQQKLETMLRLVNEICVSFSQVNLYLTKPQGGRYPGIEPDELAMFEWNSDVIYTYTDVTEVIDEVLYKDANSTGVILSLGSLYLQGNILNHLGITSDNDLSLLPKQ
jgi:dihydrofolate synthase/folylpolyglutamate synthase